MSNEEAVYVELAMQVFELEMGRKADPYNEKDNATVNVLAVGIQYALSGNLLSASDYNTLHDVIYDATDKSFSNENLLVIWTKVPDHIKASALHWGMDDTPVRDDIYTWIEKNPSVYENLTPNELAK